MSDDEEFVVVGLAEVDALDGAGVDDGWVGVFVEVLGFVDMAQGHVVQAGVFDQGGGQNQVAAEHDGALTTIGGALHRAVGGQHNGQGGIGALGEPQVDQLAQALIDLFENLAAGEGSRISAGTLAGEQAGAGDPGQGDDLERQPFEIIRAEKSGMIENVHVRDFKGVEVFQSVGAAESGGEVVVADEQEGADASPGEAHHPAAPFALEGGGGRAILIGVASEDDQVNLLLDGGIDDGIQGAEEVHDAHGQPGLRVVATIVGHVDMGVGEVEDAEHDV
jgi:hypothetical protein